MAFYRYWAIILPILGGLGIETQKAKVLRAKQKKAKFRNDSYLSGIMGNQRVIFSEYKGLCRDYTTPEGKRLPTLLLGL